MTTKKQIEGRKEDLEETRTLRIICNHTICTMFKYIKAVKNQVCEMCGGTENIEIHHKRYAPDVTIYDLQMLCRGCHNKITDRRSLEIQIAGA
jgi:5-methylcytosine-specific restriction endonuclease McrA